MRIVVGVDLSDAAVAAVEQIGLLYQPDEIVLVHGVPQADTMQGYDEFRQALLKVGRQALERCRALLPAETPSIQTLCELQHPASFILDSASTVHADLIALGTRNLSRVEQVFLGSVSHQVMLHATVPTLVVKGNAQPVNRVLMAVQGREDATHLRKWLTTYPFKNHVAVTILSVFSTLQNIREDLTMEPEGWVMESTRHAEQVVNDTAQAWASPYFTVSTDVRRGDPVRTVCEVGTRHDLIVVSSHGRKGLSRFLMGSVSQGIVHRADCSVLVVRRPPTFELNESL